MLARLDKAIFWFTLNFAMIDFRTTMLLCIVVIGVGLGVWLEVNDYDPRNSSGSFAMGAKGYSKAMQKIVLRTQFLTSKWRGSLT
jgi:hypothetical protein